MSVFVGFIGGPLAGEVMQKTEAPTFIEVALLPDHPVVTYAPEDDIVIEPRVGVYSRSGKSNNVWQYTYKGAR